MPVWQPASGRLTSRRHLLGALPSDCTQASQPSVQPSIKHTWDMLDHRVMADVSMPSTPSGMDKCFTPASRVLLASENATHTTGPDARWFGYDVHYRPKQLIQSYGNCTPRYVGLENQVLGGLFFQQVSKILLCLHRIAPHVAPGLC